MGEVRKTVVENYPVERLPDDLRRGLTNAGIVTVTIEQSTATTPQRRSLRSVIGSAKGVYPDPQHAVTAIRELRDEADGVRNGNLT